jgi:DNA-directed RNA polymerase subunit F
MNPIEAVAQKVVISLLGDLKDNHAKVQTFIESGIIPSEMKKIIEEIEKILSYLKPIINEIDSLIPESMPELKLVFDWAVKIINAIPS